MGTKAKRKAVKYDTYGPFDIGDGERAWYYVDNERGDPHINVICQLHGKGGFLGTTSVYISKAQLEAALKLMV
jgi:hypothetical protein